MQRGKVSVFIDGAHLFYAASALAIETDFTKLLPSLIGQKQLIHAYYYSGCDATNEKQSRFLQWMKYNGYRIFTKDVNSTAGDKGADFCVDMTVDMIAHADFCDTLLLLSGDGRFKRALNHIAYQGTRIELIGLREMTHESLLDVVDQYTDLADIKESFQRRSLARRHTSIKVA